MASELLSARDRMAKTRADSDRLFATLAAEASSYADSYESRSKQRRAGFQSKYPVTWRNGASEGDSFYSRDHDKECLYIESLQEALEARRTTGDDATTLPRPSAEVQQSMQDWTAKDPEYNNYLWDKPRVDAVFHGLGVELCRKLAVKLEKHFVQSSRDGSEAEKMGNSVAHPYRVLRAISRFERSPEDVTCAWMDKSESDWQALGYSKNSIQEVEAESIAAKAAAAAKEKATGTATQNQRKSLVPSAPSRTTKERKVIKATGAKKAKGSSMKTSGDENFKATTNAKSGGNAKSFEASQVVKSATVAGGRTKDTAYTGPMATGTSGNATWTTRGPHALDPDVVKIPASKSNIKEEGNKIWLSKEYETPKVRDWFRKRGIDIVDDVDVQKKHLTLVLELERDSKTTKTWTWPAPDWDSQESVSKVVSDMGQMRHRESGPFGATKTGWTAEEVKYLEDYFRGHPEKKGGVGMPMKEWQKLTDDFNATFEDRNRTAHGLWGKWDRDYVKKNKYLFNAGPSSGMTGVDGKRKAGPSDTAEGSAARKKMRVGEADREDDNVMMDTPGAAVSRVEDTSKVQTSTETGAIKGRKIRRPSGIKLRLTGLKSMTLADGDDQSHAVEASGKLGAVRTETDIVGAIQANSSVSRTGASEKPDGATNKKRKRHSDSTTATGDDDGQEDRSLKESGLKRSKSNASRGHTRASSETSIVPSLILSARMVEGRPRLVRSVGGNERGLEVAALFSITNGRMRFLTDVSQRADDAEQDVDGGIGKT